jgi:hypothetical protein
MVNLMRRVIRDRDRPELHAHVGLHSPDIGAGERDDFARESADRPLAPAHARASPLQQGGAIEDDWPRGRSSILA